MQSADQNKRFGSFLSENEIAKKVEESTPENTRKKCKWAIKVFMEWKQARIENLELDDLNVYKSIEEMDKSDWNFLLKRFVFEVRKQTGERYPPKSLYDLYAMLNFYIQKQLDKKWSLFSDIDFSEARKCLEAAMKETSAMGILSGTRRSNSISNENEMQLWETGILGKDNPRQLQNTVIYMIGIHFCIRGGRELRRLRFGSNAQIKLGEDQNNHSCLIYREDVSKCNQGGIRSIGQAPKFVYCYHNNANHDRCLPCLFELFLSKRPSDFDSEALFLTPVSNPKDPQKWYKKCALGHNSFDNIVKTLTSELRGRFTNQSLRRTGATRLFQRGFDEDMVSRQTGHKSSAIRIYKETSSEQQISISHALYDSKERNLQTREIREQGIPEMFSGTFNNCTFNVSITK